VTHGSHAPSPPDFAVIRRECHHTPHTATISHSQRPVNASLELCVFCAGFLALRQVSAGHLRERSAEKVSRLMLTRTARAPVSPVSSWLVASMAIVIWPSKIAQV